MAQLNPNFEIDFNDINSYEQIQLLNDTQLAKENLLMHKAYKEPAEDEIIRNQFSSFTFVDFCPKLFTINSTGSRTRTRPNNSASGSHRHDEPQVESKASIGSKMLRYQNYELETFSDLFDRINAWLKLNRDWRVVSMETLIFDCTTQFNHLKSSIHSSYLPRNMRGLRLYLSPSKSRFSGAQKIGCINVVPRKLSGQYDDEDDSHPLQYETLDQILTRLNELLLSRPIEGRILSVETLTLPIANGYVNTETNYFMDSRLNSLNERIYSHANNYRPEARAVTRGQSPEPAAGVECAGPKRGRAHGLVDVLRVYYEFGPRVCGLVNLIDFLPHFHRQPRTTAVVQEQAPHESPAQAEAGPSCVEQPKEQFLEIDANETLTRLIRRSLAWFECERKRILNETGAGAKCGPSGSQHDGSRHRIDLKLCNLQIHRKVLMKSQLTALRPQNVLETIQTGRMFHEPPLEPIVCARCSLSSLTHPLQEWCQHLLDLNEPFELRFVRLAYVVPVFNKHQMASRASELNIGPRPLLATPTIKDPNKIEPISSSDEELEAVEENDDALADCSSAESISRAEAPNRPEAESCTSASASSCSSSTSGRDEVDELADDLHVLEGILGAGGEPDAGELAKAASLALVRETSCRHAASERAHRLGELSDEQELSTMIGQLTYRLFAPCQLVNSSSCFSINPVNSSSPLSRRGSVNLSGGGGGGATLGLSSENATPASLLLPPASGSNERAGIGESQLSLSQTAPLTPASPTQQQVISFGAFFPALSQEILLTGAQLSPFGAAGAHVRPKAPLNPVANEFESVDAIRRRMEIYVTTNSMKVLAGETLTVNLGDQLSCLSTAIEQTIVRASFVTQRPASSWVSVYVLYAAVDEPHLPGHLLEQQRVRARQLALIDEHEEEEVRAAAGVECAAARAHDTQAGQDNLVPVFDDDFKAPSEQAGARAGRAALTLKSQTWDQSEQSPAQAAKTSASSQADGSIRVELERVGAHSSGPLYNSAYDRTVALPSQPDNHLGDYLEPVDFKLEPAQLADSLWFEEGGCDGIDKEPSSAQLPSLYWPAGSCQHEPITLTSVSVQAAQRQMRLRQGRSAMVGGGAPAIKQKQRRRAPAASKRNKSARGEQNQCSLM